MPSSSEHVSSSSGSGYGTLALFLMSVVIVSFMVHILCQNHKLHREKQLSGEKISRLFDHAVVRPARQARAAECHLEAYGLNCTARGAFDTFERIYEGCNPSLAEIVGLELDVIHDSLLKHEDQMRANIIFDSVSNISSTTMHGLDGSTLKSSKSAEMGTSQ